jgi:hypothetical protein
MTTKKAMLKVVHVKCLDCVGSSREVTLCTSTGCALHPFRQGRDPNPNPNTGFALKRRKPSKPEPDGAA